MNISHSTLRRIDALSMMVIAAAVALFVWPVSVRSLDEANTLPATPTLRPSAAPDTLDVLKVVGANLLSASRRAPDRRYVSPDVAPASEPSIPAAFAPPADTTSSIAGTVDDADAIPALYGTVKSDGVWRALLRLSNNDPNPLLLREGDKRGAYRVVSISSNAVVVAGPSGQRTLRLARPARGDSMGKSP